MRVSINNLKIQPPSAERYGGLFGSVFTKVSIRVFRRILIEFAAKNCESPDFRSLRFPEEVHVQSCSYFRRNRSLCSLSPIARADLVH